MKIKILIIILALLILFPLIEAEVGKNYETNCENGICTTNLYSYQKYYQDDGKWKEINENFKTENCEDGFDFCVDGNLYQFNSNENLSNQKITYKDSILSFGLNKLYDLTVDKPIATISGNVLNYSGIYDGIDLIYTYLPNKLKEEIVINDPKIFSNVDEDVEITFDLDSHGGSIRNENDRVSVGDTFIRNLVAYDSGVSSVSIPLSLVENELKLKIPIDWLKDE
ncbi:MAG: hypothetical protein KKB31_04740, partial [Nanoarchaeota archaeon]|nr:hypothetical protein [Nanoarchaeota archaeon]